MKRIMITASLLLPALVYAQSNSGTTKMYGQILTNEGPAEYATVRLLAAKDSSFVKGMTSDASGKFEFSQLAPGDYLLSVNSIGYRLLYSKPIKASAEKAEIQITDLVLKADSKMLKEVAVVSTVPFIETHSDKTVMNVENSVVASGSTALELLQKAPGVILDKDDNISLKGKQGVVVMIDGKSSHLSAADLANMLRSMNANEISQLEIISNPSAKYDAAGNAGIINIKTRKLKKQGFNGSIIAGAGYAQQSLYNGGINLNSRQGKFNVFGNYNYSRDGRDIGIGIDRYVTNDQVTTLFSQYGDKEYKRDNHSLKAGADYFINDRNTLSLMVTGFSNTRDGSLLNKTLMLGQNNRLDSSLIASQQENIDFKNGAVNVNYRTLLDTAGQELVIDADYMRFDKTSDQYLDNSYYNNDGSTLRPLRINRSFAPTTIDIRAIKADYVYPITRSFKLEAGLKTSFVKTDNDYRFETAQGSDWISDPAKTNYFKYDENINAAYLNLSRSFNRITVQAGLRAEHTRSEGNSVTTGIRVDSTYTRLFPSLFISHKISELHSLSLNFSQRIDRPGYQDLNPFIFMLDEYTYHQGNPYLLPQYTDVFNVTYGYKGVLFVSAGYSNTRDVMLPVLHQDDVKKTTYLTQLNMDSQTNYYLGLNASFAVTKWWSSSNNINGFYLKNKGADLDAAEAAVQINTTQNFTLPNRFRLELAGSYRSPFAYGIFDMDQVYQVDAGIQKTILNKRGSLKLSMSNIFDSEKNIYNINFRNVDMKFTERIDSRQLRLTFNYRFGNSEQKAGNRKSGIEEESGRSRKEAH